MKSKVWVYACMMIFAGIAQAYVIQGRDLEIEYWAGDGDNECVIAVDWNQTNGPYNTPFHLFGFRWEVGSQVTVKQALEAVDLAGDLVVTYAYGGGFINHMLYDQTAVDGDNHTTLDFGGWWWAGQSADGGLTWVGNEGSIENEYVWNSGIEAFNISGTNWGPGTMTIPEPATLILFGAGLCLMRKRKAENR